MDARPFRPRSEDCHGILIGARKDPFTRPSYPCGMAEGLTVQLLAMQQSGGREVAQIAVMRKQHEMEMAVANLIDEVSSKAPPPAPQGTGLVVDKRA